MRLPLCDHDLGNLDLDENQLTSLPRPYTKRYYTDTNPVTNSTLLLSVYLPTDYGMSDSRNSFSESLAKLEGFVSSHPSDHMW